MTKVNVEGVLNLPVENAVKLAKNLNSISYTEYNRVLLNPKSQTRIYWKTMIVMGQVFPERRLETIENGLKHKHWMVRNAALTLLEKFTSKNERGPLLLPLLDDPALVVRGKAARLYAEQPSVGSKELVWNLLFDTSNFRLGQSLWVRKYLARSFLLLSSKSDSARLAKLSNDSDESVRNLVVKNIMYRGEFNLSHQN